MRQRDLLGSVAHLNRSQDEKGLVILETRVLQDQKNSPEGVQK
jgi:hypothetical protein